MKVRSVVNPPVHQCMWAVRLRLKQMQVDITGKVMVWCETLERLEKCQDDSTSGVEQVSGKCRIKPNIGLC